MRCSREVMLRTAMIAGIILAPAILVLFGVFYAWGGVLTLDPAALAEHFGVVTATTLALSATAALVSAALVGLVTLPARDPHLRRIGILVAGATGASWGLACWSVVLQWVSGASPAVLLALPVCDALFSLLLFVGIVGASVDAPRPATERLARA